MKSKDPSFREVGQRSLPSSYLSRVTNRSNDFKGGVQSKAPRVSLSEFLDRKLKKSSVSPNTVLGKQMPFSSPSSKGDISGSILRKIGVENESEIKAKCVLEDVVFELFKCNKNEEEEEEEEEEDCVVVSCSHAGEGRSSDTDGEHGSRKRRNPSEGLSELRFLNLELDEDVRGDENSLSLKHLVVLGDDPKPKQKRRQEYFTGNKKPRPIYNHYANGSGWWDCDREGIDSEEVGCNEVWEGMGTTTLGGLEWH